MSYSTRSVLSLSLLLAQAMMAQEPVIKTTTRLVQLSVIARSHDQPAEGLTKEDFKVFVDGHEQKISFFSSVSALTKETAAPAPALPSNTFSNILAAKGQAPTAVTVVLLDLINTRLTDRISRSAADDQISAIYSRHRPGGRLCIQWAAAGAA